MHIDDWLDQPSLGEDKDGRNYAKFVLDWKRMPAWKQNAYEPWMKQFNLFCSYQGKRYRCTGASRMGDVWLNPDFEQDHGYEHRVDVSICSGWGPES